MAYYKFTGNILNSQPIDVYNGGHHQRDFTYIDDIVSGIVSALANCSGYEIFNLGNNQPVELEYFISIIENKLNKKAIKNYLPLQSGEVIETYANIDKAKKVLGYEPQVGLEEGLDKFLTWYQQYYGK